MVEKEKLVALNEDEKAVALKRLSEVYSTISEVYSQLKNDELTEEMKDLLFGLVESYTSEA